MSNSRRRSSGERSEGDDQGEERAGSLADLLGALLGGESQGGGLGSFGQEESTPGGFGQTDSGMGGLGQGGSVLGSLLGALLGGGETAQQGSWGGQPQQQAQPGLGAGGDLIGALLGGSMGGGMGSSMGGIASLLTPLIAPLAQKLGIPVEIAQIVVIFVLSKLLSGKLGLGTTPQTQAQVPSQQAGMPGGFDLASFLQQMSSGRSVDTGYLRSSGLTDELVQQTGLDPSQAEQGLQEVLRMLSSPAEESGYAEPTATETMEGQGQGVIRRRAGATGTEVAGQVVDQRNGRGIGDVLVIALRPGVGVREFIRQPLREMAYTSVYTSADGRFVFPQQLPKGYAYGLVVVANGYRDVAIEDALRIEPQMPEQAELNPIPLMPD